MLLHVTLCVWAQVISCEMVEAVGHANLPAYMQAIGRLLKSGGTAVVQVPLAPVLNSICQCLILCIA